MIRSAISDVVRFPVRNQTIFGGLFHTRERSKKSASKVTMVNPLSRANRHISASSRLLSPTAQTCRQSANVPDKCLPMRYEIFWSKSSFIRQTYCRVRSRWDAKARQARISLRVNSGKSATISSKDIPADNHPSTS